MLWWEDIYPVPWAKWPSCGVILDFSWSNSVMWLLIPLLFNLHPTGRQWKSVLRCYMLISGQTLEDHGRERTSPRKRLDLGAGQAWTFLVIQTEAVLGFFTLVMYNSFFKIIFSSIWGISVRMTSVMYFVNVFCFPPQNSLDVYGEENLDILLLE